MTTVFMKNLIPVSIGFLIGYSTKSVLSEVKHPDDKIEMSRVIERGKKVYDSATTHPERIPRALHDAEKTLENNDGSRG